MTPLLILVFGVPPATAIGTDSVCGSPRVRGLCTRGVATSTEHVGRLGPEALSERAALAALAWS
jgi:hypothetical protein